MKTRGPDGKITPEYRKEYYARNLERERERRLKYFHAHKEDFRRRQMANWHKILQGNRLRAWNLRLEFFAAYGNKCTCCGESEPYFLTIEHLNNDGRQHRAQFNRNNVAIITDIKRLGYPADYTVLCYNCNMAKRYGPCPHQTRKEEVI